MDTQNHLICDETLGLELLYRGKSLNKVQFQQQLTELFNSQCEYLDVAPITSEQEYSQDFLLPAEYQNLDVLSYLAARVPDDADRQARVAYELSLFQARNLFPILRMLIYIVDQMRHHKIVWGVGRGSSVASYCLYLIGVHKIDSYLYDLSIHEFLK